MVEASVELQEAPAALMESTLGQALAGTGTSNNWSTLEGVTTKVGKRLGRVVNPKEID